MSKRASKQQEMFIVLSFVILILIASHFLLDTFNAINL